jgi:hypothetical protein
MPALLWLDFDFLATGRIPGEGERFFPLDIMTPKVILGSSKDLAEVHTVFFRFQISVKDDFAYLWCFVYSKAGVGRRTCAPLSVCRFL